LITPIVLIALIVLLARGPDLSSSFGINHDAECSGRTFNQCRVAMEA
jgi:hypothetical protein